MPSALKREELSGLIREVPIGWWLGLKGMVAGVWLVSPGRWIGDFLLRMKQRLDASFGDRASLLFTKPSNSADE